MLNRFFDSAKRMLVSRQGSAPAVSFVILAPLILVVALGLSWLGHMADAQNVTEEAARAGARWLAVHPGDIAGAKARAAEVVEGAMGGKYIAGGSITNTSLDDKLIGKLSKIDRKYYIADRNLGSVRVKPANGSIKSTMEALLDRTVIAAGAWKDVYFFFVNAATTNPPETQTVNQTVPDQGTGSQTVSQTRRPGPFPAATLSKYGEPYWGTDWGTEFLLDAWWLWGQGSAISCALDGQEVQLSKSGFLNYYATYVAYAVADDHFRTQIVSQNYSSSDFLSGDAVWVDGKVPAFSGGLWVSKAGSSLSPEPFASSFTINAWNDYGPAGAIFTLKHTGWRWPTAFTPTYDISGWFLQYPGWSVPYAQWVNITAKNRSGKPAGIYVDDLTNNRQSVAIGERGTCSFYAYPGITYSVFLDSDTVRNDLSVSFDGGTALRTDSTWQYAPVDGIGYGSATLPTNVRPGTTFDAQVRVTNTGRKEWYGQASPPWYSYLGLEQWGATRLAYHWYDQSGNLVVMDGLRTALPDLVNPGEAADRIMPIQAPVEPGTYTLSIDSVQEYVAWFGPCQGVNWPTIDANVVVGDESRDVYFSPTTIPRYMIRGRYSDPIKVTVTNKGTEAWSGNFLGYYWLDSNGVKTGLADYFATPDVPPGFSFSLWIDVLAPGRRGTYSLVISMASDGVPWSEDTQNPCPYIKADVQVPAGDMLQGMITYDGEDYWIGTTLLVSRGPDLSALAGRNAIVWGISGLTDVWGNSSERMFIVSSIEEYFPDDWNAVVTFSLDKDTLCNDPTAGDPDAPEGDSAGRPRADGYAYCRVTYHYPVPLRGLWAMVSRAGVPLWRGEEPPSRALIGEAFFVSGEMGDLP